jgi:MFS family permease
LNLRFLIDDIQISFKKTVAITIVTSGSLALFFLIPFIGVNLILFYGFGALSAVAGGLLSSKIDRRKLLWSWIILGVVSTIFLGYAQGTGLFLVASVFAGLSVGLGLPSSIAFFADNTIVEERARISGIIIIETFAMVIFVLVFQSILALGPVESFLLIAAMRSVSFLGLILDKSFKVKVKEKSYLTILSHRDFALYLSPWILFNFAAGLSSWWSPPPTPEYDFVRSTGRALFYLCVAVFGLLSGIAADRFGRKQPILIGLVMLGVSFALLGYNINPLSFLIYELTLGIAWGFLLVVYLAIPGDIAGSFEKEKSYVLATIIPFILYIGLTAVPQLTHIKVTINSLSPVLSIVLFLAIIPIVRAKETLLRKKIEARKMKEHLEKLGELIEESKASH